MDCQRCGKVYFSSRAKAERRLREIWTDWNASGTIPTSTYFDARCGCWHLTSKVAPRRGNTPAVDISGLHQSWRARLLASAVSSQSMKLTLRDYQEYAVQSVFNYFTINRGNPVVGMPTGTGKSIVIGELTRRACTLYPGTRILMLTHRKELIEQNMKKLLELWPTAPAGIYSAGLKRRELKHAVTFAGIQSIYKRAPELGHIDLVFIDECHLVPPKADTMYTAFIADILKINPKAKIVGFTATAYRLKHGMLTDEGGLFTDICCDMTSRNVFNWLIAQGWLCPLVPRRMENTIDVSGVRIQGGEYNQTELQEVFDREAVTYAALKEAVAVASDRKHWLIFASGIDHTEHIVGQLDSFGIDAVAVHSRMDGTERDKCIAAFRTGKVRVIVNSDILTTGFDYPDIDCIVMLRATASPGLWVQMLGRGTRPLADTQVYGTAEERLAAIRASAKPNCLVLDFAGNTARLGPINDPVLPKRPGRGAPGLPPVRLCEHCDCYSHASARFCEHCGAEFPRAVKFGPEASTKELIVGPGLPPGVGKPLPREWFDVQRVVYTTHQKPGKPVTMRVDYYCGVQRFTEFVSLDHGGNAARIAREWWTMRCPWGVPPSVEDGMKAVNYLKTPRRIQIMFRGPHDWPEVKDYEFTES